MFNMHATSAGAAAAYPEVYRQLMSVGLLGAIYRAREDAQIVHEAVETTLADPTGYRMCRAIALGMGGDVGDAGTTLAEHLERNPGDDNAKVAMAVSLMFAGDPEWKQWLDNVLATSTEQSAREAATGVLSPLASMAYACSCCVAPASASRRARGATTRATASVTGWGSSSGGSLGPSLHAARARTAIQRAAAR